VYDVLPCNASEKEPFSRASVPPTTKIPTCMFSGPLTGVNGELPVSVPGRMPYWAWPRSGPRPGCVTMSMKKAPALWFSAAKPSRVMWTDLICAFGGSGAPSKLSTRMIAGPPAISASCWRRTAGSSDSASICSRVSADPNVVARSTATSCRSRATFTVSASF